MEGLDGATHDIKGALLQTDWDKGDIHINMYGATVFLLEEIYLAYYKVFIYIDIRGKNAGMNNPRRTYMAL